MRKLYFWILLFLLAAPVRGEEPKHFSIDTALGLREVSEPRLSPEGNRVAYIVSSLDLKADEQFSHLFMVSTEEGEVVQLTRGESSASHPRWSPDGRYLGFLASRKEEKSQVWLLDRRGGEPFEVTAMKGGVSDFEWAPDGARLALVARDPDPSASEEDSKEKRPEPIVVTRLQFKRDRAGYLKDLFDHLYLVELESRQVRQLTSGPRHERSPRWAPGGEEIVFVSNRSENPDSNRNTDLFLIPAEGGEIQQLTRNPGPDGSPAWSPDGKRIAYTTVTEPELIWYATEHLALIERDGGSPTILTRSVDRNVAEPRFSRDGAFVYFLLEDSGNQHLARLPAGGGEVERVISGERDVLGFHFLEESKKALLVTDPMLPAGVFLEEGGGTIRPLTATNRDLLSEVRLGEVENIHFQSADGAEIEGFLTRPPGFREGESCPGILWIHGGPVAQFSTEFNPVWQVFAGAGYVVVAANPRGSSGYGQEFSKAIWADWGNKDYQDVMAAVDHVIAKGSLDPERLGVGGWSYGGILTNYVITQTDRFRAAATGASETNFWACYGTDHYQYEWEKELGLPWENLDLYIKLSPLSRVAKIVTPALIMCGEKDWNVPLNQSEQLYQSLKRLGRETMLIIYPDQSHGISVPSYQRDRYERYLEWFDRWLFKERP